MPDRIASARAAVSMELFTDVSGLLFLGLLAPKLSSWRPQGLAFAAAPRAILRPIGFKVVRRARCHRSIPMHVEFVRILADGAKAEPFIEPARRIEFHHAEGHRFPHSLGLGEQLLQHRGPDPAILK